jgi:RNA polymerase sigma factor (sigma-70 family)
LPSELQSRFVEQNMRRIFLLIYRIVRNVDDAQDLTQEAFIKALQRQDQLKDLEKAAHWLSRIASNTAIDFLRRSGRVTLMELDDAPAPALRSFRKRRRSPAAPGAEGPHGSGARRADHSRKACAAAARCGGHAGRGSRCAIALLQGYRAVAYRECARETTSFSRSGQEARMKHVSESDLALYASGDLSGLPRWSAALHVRRCGECRELVEAHRTLRSDARRADDAVLGSLNWERLSAEMTANIHVGLAAGECVTPPVQKRQTMSPSNWFWHPVTAMIAAGLVFTAAWWLNFPSDDKVALSRVMRGLPARVPDDRGPVVAATSEGIEFRENGGSLGLRQNGAELMEVSLSTNGSASAHYIGDDADQVMIATVYGQ